MYRLDSTKFVFNNFIQHFPYKIRVQIRGIEDIDISDSRLDNVGMFYSVWRSNFRKSFFLSTNYAFVEMKANREFEVFDKKFVLTSAYCEDASGGIWLGSFDNGLFRYKSGDLGEESSNYLSGETVTSILFDQAGGLWASTLESGIFYTSDINLQSLYSPSGDQLVSFDLSIGNDMLYCIHKGNRTVSLMKESLFPEWSAEFNLTDPILDKAVWNESLFLKLRNERYLRKINKDALTTTGISSSAIQTNKNILISYFYAQNEGRLDFFDENESYHRSVKGIGDRGLEFLFATDSNSLYCHDRQGSFNFLVYNENEIEIKSCNTSLGNVEFVDLNSLNDGKNALISKNSGIFIFKNEKLEKIISPFSKSDTILNSVFLDSNRITYFLTNRGVYRSNELFGKPELFLSDNLGLPSNFVYNMVIFSRKLIFATAGGVVYTDRSFAPKINDKPLSKEIRLKHDGKDVKAHVDLSIPHDFLNLHFSFEAILYSNAFNIEYRYRLRQNEDWNALDGRSLILSSLQPGNYELEVQASEASGKWGESSFFMFTIDPPFWQKPLFFILSFLGFVLVGIFVLKFRERRLKRQIMLEEELLNAQNQALSSQLKPYFIFNSMNSLVAFISTKDEKNSLRYLANLSKLIRFIFDSSESNLIPIAKELESLEHYLELEKLRFDISYEIECDKELASYLIPPLLLQPLVENAVIHGVEKGQGMIRIHIQSSEDVIISTVENTGNPLKVSQLSESTGSLSMIKRRLEILKTLKNLDIGLEIEAINKDSFVTRAQITFPKLKA